MIAENEEDNDFYYLLLGIIEVKTLFTPYIERMAEPSGRMR